MDLLDIADVRRSIAFLVAVTPEISVVSTLDQVFSGIIWEIFLCRGIIVHIQDAVFCTINGKHSQSAVIQILRRICSQQNQSLEFVGMARSIGRRHCSAQ